MSNIAKRVVVIGDVHFPFHHSVGIAKAINFIKQTKPDLVIQVGDLYDLFSFSKYPKTLNVSTPQQECLTARALAAEFWKQVRKASPSSKCVQLTGNHDDRMVKRVLENSPAHHHIVKGYIDGLMTFDGVETIYDSKEEFIYDGVCYMHGFRKFGEHAVYNQMSTITGHLHRAGLQYNQNSNGLFYEMNVGWLGDKTSPAFDYKAQNRITKTTLGLGYVDPLGPRFVSLE